MDMTKQITVNMGMDGDWWLCYERVPEDTEKDYGFIGKFHRFSLLNKAIERDDDEMMRQEIKKVDFLHAKFGEISSYAITVKKFNGLNVMTVHQRNEKI